MAPKSQKKKRGIISFFLWLSSIPLGIYVPHLCPLICQWTSRWLYVLTVVNSAAVNTGAPVSFLISSHPPRLVFQVLTVQPCCRPPAQGDQLPSFPAGWTSDAQLSPHPLWAAHALTHLPHTHTHTHTHTHAHTHTHTHTPSAYLSAPLALGLTLHLLQDFICEEIFI